MTTTASTPTEQTVRSTALFEPTELGGIPLSNRFAMAPMTRFRSPDGAPDAEVAEYYRRRAEGGIGLIISEGVLVDHPSAGSEADAPRLSPPTSTAGWEHVVEQVHGAGGRILAQLWHQGSERETPDGVRPWTPSGVREDGSPIGHAMTIADIEALTQTYVDAGVAAQQAGFDGLEVHAAHGYLLDEFLWPATNRRTDRYGGAAGGRSRIVAEIIAALRAAVGPHLPISVRFSQFKERQFDATIAADPGELEALLTPLVDAGATIVHASTRRAWLPAFAGSERTLAGWARDLTGLPTIAVGSVGLTGTDLDRPDGPGLPSLERLLEREEFDVIALGRALLANPRWVEHARAGQADRIVDYAKEHELIYP